MLKKEVFLAKIRGKETVLESVLNKNQIEQSMFDRWISQVHENIPLFQQLWKVRMKYIGIDDFHYYDLYAPVVPECFPTVTIEQATDIIYNACTPLGEEYQEVLKQAFQYVIYDEFLPSSYAVNIYNIHPIALVNFKGSLSDLLVLAHELGHVVHMKYTNQHNSFINSEVTDLSSEIAALTNELLVLEYLIETNKNVEQKRHLYNMLIHKFHNHIFRQTLLTEFEKKIYEHVENGMSLTGKFLSTQYSKLQAKYYGKSFVDSFSGNEWMSIPHLFSTFYMLIYPFAFYGALKIVEKVKSNQAISDHYAEFLSNRNSNLLKELFQEIQLDQEHHYKMLYELIATILNQYISVMGS
ncbi:M3 family metallopeptidase [Brevibacillus gelatini]